MNYTAVSARVQRRVIQFQVLTIVWMVLETTFAFGAALHARSPALLGFGGDSAIELLSAIVVLWRFRSATGSQQKSEKVAARVTGLLLFVVAGFVALTSTLSLFGHREPMPSLVGIILLIAAAIFMPWLASRKRKLATETGSASLRADATESAVCGYLSLIALAGLLANAIFHLRWADPAAALILVPLIASEGWQALHTSRRCCN